MTQKISKIIILIKIAASVYIYIVDFTDPHFQLYIVNFIDSKYLTRQVSTTENNIFISILFFYFVT